MEIKIVLTDPRVIEASNKLDQEIARGKRDKIQKAAYALRDIKSVVYSEYVNSAQYREDNYWMLAKKEIQADRLERLVNKLGI